MRRGVTAIAGAAIALGLAACGGAGPPLAKPTTPLTSKPSGATNLDCPSAPAPGPPEQNRLQAQLDAMIDSLPDRELITSAAVGDDIPPGAGASGSGAWVSLVSDAPDLRSQFRVRWESEIVTAALWKQNGESNAIVSGGGVEFTVPNAIRENMGFHYGFADNAKNYLFTDSHDDPARLTADPAELCARIEAGATKMHVTLTSISIFGVLGTDVAVLARARSLDAIDENAGLFGDYTNLEGAYFLLTDPDGNELASWSYSTGWQVGHGGLQPGDAVMSRTSAHRAP
jgi:hypothetical protein